MSEAFLQQSSTGLWQSFNSPLQVIQASTPSEVLPALREIEYLVEKKSWFAVGFVSYEAAPGFDSALRVRTSDAISDISLPLLSFTLYAGVEILPYSKIFTTAHRNGEIEPSDTLDAWLPSIDRTAYGLAIDTIRAHIVRGDTYQVNYTWRFQRSFSGDPKEWFSRMIASQRSQHAAYLDIGPFVILSASPELFFSLDNQRLVTRPMKGTAARAPTSNADILCANTLLTSSKDRAENLMIVDMTRNDLGRIAILGSVQVPSLFTIEKYPTVWQMTSTVNAITEHSVTEIFRALFPAASVTGAPKVNTMKMIADLETTPRGLYTGAIGCIAPGRRAEFNVAIRTMVLERERGIAQYGVGGGIVWDSKTNEEYAECLTKARILWVKQPDFLLLETLRWTPVDGFFLMDEHLERMIGSANYFGYLIDPQEIRRILSEISSRFPNKPQKIRLLLDRDGDIRTESATLDESNQKVLLSLAVSAIDSSNPFFYHKTTHRVEYERARQASQKGTDVLLYNERDEVTETTVANVVIELDGERVTPPISAGLLAGTYRRKLLEEGEIREKTVKLTEIERATALWIINSVRGWQRAVLAI